MHGAFTPTPREPHTPPMRPEDQTRIKTELKSRLVDEKVRLAQEGKLSLDEVIADSIYYERARLKEDHHARAHDADLRFWEGVQRRLPRANERGLERLLGEIVARYAEEICGNFDDRIYKLSTRILPPAIGLLVNAVSPKRLLHSLPDLPQLEEQVVVQGETEHLRRLHERGTVILCPTHVSNLDSIVMGLAIYRLGLPPFIYGAGLNLFENPLLGFFMRNLGAYTVDRKKKDPLYKEALKTYATLTLEYGYDNLFFPGGTRSRSGAIERHLKLGLLGTSIPAYIDNLLAEKPDPRIYIVPATLSFQLCLEAETLIDDFLKEVGKSRYIITDDEFSRPATVLDFIRQLFNLDSKIYVTLSRGYDPFGNAVDDEGQSLDPRGRTIDPKAYVLVDGAPTRRPQRDAEYTKELGQRVVDAFMRDNVIQSTHLTARALFTLLRRHNREIGLLRLIRVGGPHDNFDQREVYRETDRLLQELRGLERRGGIRLAPHIRDAAADEIVADGLRHFAIFHSQPAAERRGDRIFAVDRNLLFYYQNRLEGYRLDRTAGLPPALAPDHRSLGVSP